MENPQKMAAHDWSGTDVGLLMIVRNKVHFNESDNTEPSVFLIAPEGLFSFEIHTVKESKTAEKQI